MNRGFVLGAALTTALILLTLGQMTLISSCTPQQRAVVRDVTTLIDQLCGDHDTIDTCLGKASAARAQARAAAAADAGVDAAGDAP